MGDGNILDERKPEKMLNPDTATDGEWMKWVLETEEEGKKRRLNPIEDNREMICIRGSWYPKDQISIKFLRNIYKEDEVVPEKDEKEEQDEKLDEIEESEEDNLDNSEPDVEIGGL